MWSHKQESLSKTRNRDPELFAKSKRPTCSLKPLFQNFRFLNSKKWSKNRVNKAAFLWARVQPSLGSCDVDNFFCNFCLLLQVVVSEHFIGLQGSFIKCSENGY